MRGCRLLLVGLLGLGVAACGDDDATVTTAVTTTAAVMTTALACTPPASTSDRIGAGFPNGLSPRVGADARIGLHPCFERFVIEFGGTGPFPGWFVRYVPLPVRADPSDLPVDLPGAGAAIVVTIQAWMPDPFGNVGYSGPTTLPSAGFRTFRAVTQVGNFESTASWALGVDRVRGFSTMVLSDPPRLVIDVATG